MLQPERDDALQRRANEALVHRAISGVFVYLFLLAVVLRLTPVLSVAPRTAGVAVAWSILMALVRLWIARHFAAIYARSPTTWRRLFVAAILATIIPWGLGCAYFVSILHDDALLFLLPTAGICAGAMPSPYVFAAGPSTRAASTIT